MIFEILGTPISKKRHRTVKRGCFIHSYDPQAHLKNLVRQKFIEEMKKNGWVMFHKNIALEVRIECYFDIPNYLPQKQKNIYAWGFGNQYITLDLDNIYKFFTDAGNGIIYHDDRQIVSSYCDKQHGLRYGETEKTVIYVTPYSELKNPRIEEILSTYSPVDIQNLINTLHVLQNKFKEVATMNDEWEIDEFANIISKLAHDHSHKLSKIQKINDKYRK